MQKTTLITLKHALTHQKLPRPVKPITQRHSNKLSAFSILSQNQSW
jgi:hypothetical protein